MGTGGAAHHLAAEPAGERAVPGEARRVDQDQRGDRRGPGALGQTAGDIAADAVAEHGDLSHALLLAERVDHPLRDLHQAFGGDPPGFRGGRAAVPGPVHDERAVPVGEGGQHGVEVAAVPGVGVQEQQRGGVGRGRGSLRPGAGEGVELRRTAMSPRWVGTVIRMGRACRTRPLLGTTRLGGPPLGTGRRCWEGPHRSGVRTTRDGPHRAPRRVVRPETGCPAGTGRTAPPDGRPAWEGLFGREGLSGP